MDNSFVEKEEKKSNLLVVVLLFVIGCLLCFIGMLYLNNSFKKEEVKNLSKKKLEVNGVLVKTLINKVNGDISDASGWNYENVGFDYDKATAAQKNKFIKYNIVEYFEKYYSCSDSKYMKKSSDGRYVDYCIGKKVLDGKFLDRKYVETIYKDLFGKDEKLDTNEPFFMHNLEVEGYFYDKVNDVYVKMIQEGGGITGTKYKGVTVDAYTEANKLVITDKVEEYDKTIKKTSEYKVEYTFINDGEGYRIRTIKKLDK